MDIEIDFLFAEDVKALMEGDNIEPFPNYMTAVNGATCVAGGFSFINLNADRWKIDLAISGENGLIKELCPIIMHELIHQCVGTKYYKDVLYTIEGEERVCLLMTGQQKLRNEV